MSAAAIHEGMRPVVLRMRIERGDGEEMRVVHEDSGVLLFIGPDMAAVLGWLEEKKGQGLHPSKNLRDALEAGATPHRSGAGESKRAISAARP